MDDTVSTDEPAAGEFEAPGPFLEKLRASLLLTEGVDTELAKILNEHLIVLAPAKDGVTKARDAIDKLAEKRANAQEACDD